MISGGADNNIKVLDLVSGQTTQVKAHDQPVKCVRTFTANGTPMAVTGSWDKTIKYWDFRSDQPAMTVACQERVYALDVRDDLLVVGTADRYLNVVKMNDPSRFYKTIQSPLKWQTRVVSCFLKGKGDDGYAIGSIEGRCAIQYVEEKDSAYVGPLLPNSPRIDTTKWVELTSDTPSQLQLFLQMSPRHSARQRHQRTRSQRHLLPPAARHLQHSR